MVRLPPFGLSRHEDRVKVWKPREGNRNSDWYSGEQTNHKRDDSSCDGKPPTLLGLFDVRAVLLLKESPRSFLIQAASKAEFRGITIRDCVLERIGLAIDSLFEMQTIIEAAHRISA